jgi:hypothetical protein
MISMTALDIAIAYAERGWNPLPLPHRQKRPTDVGWQHRVITTLDAGLFFNSKAMNIGVVLGPSSHGLVDVDLDCDEAITIAPAVMPPTKAIFGRASARGSHRLYYHPTLAASVDRVTLQFKDPTNDSMVLEVRVGGGDKGAQTVFPGSTHETGEAISWDETGEPATVGDDLVQRAKITAALCLLARAWPRKQPGQHGSRHDAALTIGGFLARCGFDVPRVKLYVESIARAAHDEERRDRVKAAEDCALAWRSDKPTRGYPELRKLAGDKVADRVAEWLDYQGTREDVADDAAEPAAAITATPYVCEAPESIPPRQWLYGKRLLRQIVSATVAPGGIGKTSLTVADALAMASGKALLGIMPPQPLRVWIWNLEEPRGEMQRQIAATMKRYDLRPEDIGDRLFVDTVPLVVATTTREKAMVLTPVIDALVAELKRRQIDVLIIDPFVSCHELSENDNKHMDLVVKAWKRVAEAANCAIELVHHTRKGESEITAESSRGGGAFVDTCRNVRVINRMSKEEAANLGITNHRLYFRTFSDKANKVPPADQSDWFKLESVDLCNGPPGESDSIGVPHCWKWPDALAGMTAEDFDKVAAVVRGGTWRESVQAKMWVGRAVAKALGMNVDNRKDKTRISGMLKVWLAAGSLVVVERPDEHREARLFVEVA